MYKIFICDDDVFTLMKMKEIISKEIAQLDEMAEVITIDNPLEIVFAELNADICFLDIDMPQINGIDLAKELHLTKPELIIIFVTNKDEFVYDSFVANPFRFLRKESFSEKINRVLMDAFTVIQHQRSFLVLEINREIHRIPQKEILYLEKYGNYVSIYTRNHDIWQLRSSLQKLETELNQHIFVKTYPSLLINMNYIADFRHSFILLNNNVELPVSRRLKEKARSKYMRFLVNNC